MRLLTRLLLMTAVAGLASALLPCSRVHAAEPPAIATHAPSGKSLVVPDPQKELGTIYYALPGRDVQVTFNSKAPIEEIKGTSGSVIGYVISPKVGDPAALVAG